MAMDWNYIRSIFGCRFNFFEKLILVLATKILFRKADSCCTLSDGVFASFSGNLINTISLDLDD